MLWWLPAVEACGVRSVVLLLLLQGVFWVFPAGFGTCCCGGRRKPRKAGWG